MSRRWSNLSQAMAAYKPSATGISLSVRNLYSSVLQSSIDCGFGADQVKIIWRTASQAYLVGEISLAFESVIKELQSTSIFNASNLSWYSAASTRCTSRAGLCSDQNVGSSKSAR
ncbi:hypothetical protein PCPL58_2600 [Pseudomonas cerasi]|uniref:Uncharacterized protein n=1 Tax=Pseudomonas cerasi TaxID=1583341 RepID=A0A193SPF8_9PSED|nr:hypothetical protein PCPL58_2600 [Pseudomonas cerasi]SOS20928.1 hypothetical protein PL963_02830 [Pseudomonas cerasi]